MKKQEDAVPENLEDLELQLMAQREELSRLDDASVGSAHQQIEGKVEKIDEALEKLNEGTYGICESCGDPIHAERLEALPYATRCITCQREDERHS